MARRLLASVLAVLIVATVAPQSATAQVSEPAVVATIAINSPTAVQRDPLSNRLIVASAQPQVYLLDSLNLNRVSTITTNVPNQTMIQLGTDGSRAYIIGNEPIISVIQVTDGNLVAQIPLNGDDRNAAGSLISQADVPLLLVTYRRQSDSRLGAISIISTVTNFNRLTAVFPVETAGLALPRGKDVMLMAGYGQGTLYFLDTFFQPIAEISLEGTPDQILVSADGSRAYVTNPATGFIDIIDVDLRQLVSRIAIGSGMSGASLSSDGTRIAAAIPSTGELVLADTATAQVLTRKKIAVNPVSTAFGDSSRHVYVADQAGNAVLKVDTQFIRAMAPQKVAASVVANGVRISWKPPAQSGTEVVSRYTVTSVPKGGKCVTTRTSCTLTGLKRGKTYTVRVTADTSGVPGIPATSPKFTAR